MLAKTVEQGGKNWDLRIPYVLFAYRASLQTSTHESPFYLLCGRDPQLPTNALMQPPANRQLTDTDDYKTQLSLHMAEAWELAKANVQRAQNQQKVAHDRHSRPGHFKPGDRVFVHMPGAKQGPAHKFARTFHGPFRVKEVVDNGVVVYPVDQPQKDPIRVAMNRI